MTTADKVHLESLSSATLRALWRRAVGGASNISEEEICDGIEKMCADGTVAGDSPDSAHSVEAQ